MFMALTVERAVFSGWRCSVLFVTLGVIMLPKTPLISWYQRFSCLSLLTAVTKGRHLCAWFPALFVSY